MSKTNEADEEAAVRRFREFLRFPTVQPDPDYSDSIVWLEEQAAELGLEFHHLNFPAPNEFAVWLTWQGTDPTLTSILLNSHLDVVPADSTQWTHDPFAAEMDDAGNIYARGAQDMKCVGVQYLEAIRKLKTKGVVPPRSVHVSFVPDEERGGRKGMGYFVGTPEFRNLKVGFALDEGIASSDNTFRVFYGQRVGAYVRVSAKGRTGHGSLLLPDTAGEKLVPVLRGLMDLRTEQRDLYHSCPTIHAGDVTSVNLTMLEGGLARNVLPPELSAVFDIRISPQWDLEKLSGILTDLCAQAGDGVSFEYISASSPAPHTSIGPENPWWNSFKAASDSLGLELKTRVFPAATDLRYVQQLGVPGFGFSPMNNTPILLHDHDEHLNQTVFLRGITIYEVILEGLIHVPSSTTTST